MEQKKNINWSKLGLIGIIAIIIIAIIVNTGEKRGYSQKETITYNNTEYSIKKVEKDDENIIVTIKIKNIGNEPLSYSDINFYMLNQKGDFVKKKPLVFDDGTILPNGKLEPNEEVEGSIIWLQDKKHKSLRIRYYKNILTSEIDDYEFEWSLD